MKLGFVSTTVSIAFLASATEARFGASRNLVDKNFVQGAFVDSTITEGVGLENFNVTEGTAEATVSKSSTSQEATEDHHLGGEQDATEKIYEEQPKPLPSYDQVMHKDAPKHGTYVEGGSDRIRSFCARHNHFGPNSGCEQHQASLRGSRTGKTTNTGSTSGEDQ
eukprot:CAMPEP_0116134920 /NCGR_PEP_ID=MMETSP0329-20121206/10915_1 /TAXON_ID=697910 /ORGANISM="Pseudo-nitzschia arenysensis, Strain B593" /LENGTH=164 /DNA_ID=CAMNT_0003629687 /DNA_START=80 /DNA_END=574 /DNA_ORIENTATION=-